MAEQQAFYGCISENIRGDIRDFCRRLARATFVGLRDVFLFLRVLIYAPCLGIVRNRICLGRFVAGKSYRNERIQCLANLLAVFRRNPAYARGDLFAIGSCMRCRIRDLFLSNGRGCIEASNTFACSSSVRRTSRIRRNRALSISLNKLLLLVSGVIVKGALKCP